MGVAGVLVSMVILVTGHLAWGLLGLVGSVAYALLFRRWDEDAAPHAPARSQSRRRFRWPRYSEHPIVNRLRWISVIAALVIVPVALVASLASR